MPDTTMPVLRVLSLGGGVPSTTFLLMALDGDLPSGTLSDAGRDVV